MTTLPTSESSPPAPSDDALTDGQFQGALVHAARDTFWPVSLGLGVIYTFTAISHGLRLDPDVRLPLTLSAAITGILLLALGIYFRRRPLPARMAHGMVGMLTLFAFANEVLQQQLTPNPFHQIFTSLFLLGTGVLVLSRRWLALGLALGFVSWAAAYARSDDGVMVEWLYAHGAATATGCAAHVARRRTIHRIESLHQADIRHAAHLQTALSELRESEAQFRQFVDKSEQINRANQQRLSDLIADIDGIVWECDPHTMAFTFVSPRVESILGFSTQWLLKPLRFFDIVHSDDRERIEQFCVERVARGLDHEMNHRVLAADGRVVWMNAKSRVIKDATGRVVRVRGILLDVSESMRTAQALRDSQAILDRAQEIAQLGSWTWEQARGRVIWSPQMYRIHGITPEQFDGTWMKAYEMIHPDDQSRIWRLCEQAIDQGEVESFEYRLIRGDGSVAIVRADGELQLDEQGRLERIIGTVQDVTELRSAEAERARLENELRQIQKLDAVGTLASGVAHDFNNLLTAIHGYADLARQTLGADDAARQSLDMIEVAADQAAGVTQGLLTFAHRTPYERTTIDLVPNIRQSLQLLRRLLPASIELVEDLPAEGEVWIHADAHQLQQVWMNLTVNARDAMPNGGRLVIQLRRQPQGPASPHDSWHGHTHYTHDTAIITVTDTGTGMTEQTIARIYEPYFTTKARGQGTGLGLSIVHGIISDHAGRIQVQSEVGKGTRFSLQLPCTDPPQPATATGDTQTNIGHGEMIMLAEDNEFVRAIMVASLTAAGYSVITAGDGHEAMAAYRNHRARLRLIILDLDLPKQSGDQCLTAIREAGDQVPIIVITGNVGDTRQGMQELNELTLLKPFQVARMTEMVNHVLRENEPKADAPPMEQVHPFKDLN